MKTHQTDAIKFETLLSNEEPKPLPADFYDYLELLKQCHSVGTKSLSMTGTVKWVAWEGAKFAASTVFRVAASSYIAVPAISYVIIRSRIIF